MPRLTHRLRGAAGAALSRGPGYEPQPAGTNVSTDAVRGYFVDLRPKAAARLRRRINARGEVSQPGPTAIAQRALGLHEHYVAEEAEARAPFLREIERLLRRAAPDGAGLLWQYDVDVPKFRRRAPWHSCMAQGQAASALVRAYLATGRETYADAARAALVPLMASGDVYGLVTSTPSGPVLEECPSDPPSHILNGWIYGLWGLWDAAVGLRWEEARRLFDASAGTLAHRLPDYDTGWWSRYSLYPPAAPDLAKPFYHRIHVTQLEVMSRLTGAPAFASAAARWCRYDRSSSRARAVVCKGLTVVRV